LKHPSWFLRSVSSSRLQKTKIPARGLKRDRFIDVSNLPSLLLQKTKIPARGLKLRLITNRSPHKPRNDFKKPKSPRGD